MACGGGCSSKHSYRRSAWLLRWPRVNPTGLTLDVKFLVPCCLPSFRGRCGGVILLSHQRRNSTARRTSPNARATLNFTQLWHGISLSRSAPFIDDRWQCIALVLATGKHCLKRHDMRRSWVQTPVAAERAGRRAFLRTHVVVHRDDMVVDRNFWSTIFAVLFF